MKNTEISTGVLLLAGLLFHGTSYSYELLRCNDGSALKWDTNTVTMYPYALSSSHENAFEYALDRWNRNPSKFRFALGNESVYNILPVPKKIKGNGLNEAYWVDSAVTLGAVARALIRTSCSRGEILEADVVFANQTASSLTTSQSKSQAGDYGGSKRSFQGVAIHELGHVVGLGDYGGAYNVMGIESNHVHAINSSIYPYVGEDASDGAVAIYGSNSSTDVRDVSVAHWRYDAVASAGQQYSQHVRTRILDSAGNERSKNMENGEPRYAVTSGQTVQVEFTYENSSETTKTFDFAFFLSTNQTITDYFDDLIASFPNMTISPDSVFTKTHTIKIPTGLALGGKYSIGVIVDTLDEIDEIDESNNTSYIDIYISLR